MAELTLDDLPPNDKFLNLPWIDDAIQLLRRFDCLNEDFYRVFFEEILTDEVFQIRSVRKYICDKFIRTKPYSEYCMFERWPHGILENNGIMIRFERFENECVYLEVKYKDMLHYVRQYC